MTTYIVLIFLFIMFIVILEILNFGLLIFLILVIKGIIKYREKSPSNMDVKQDRGFGFGK